MTGLKLTAAMALTTTLLGFIESTQIEAWSKLGATSLLGGALFYVLWSNARDRKSTMQTHEKVCSGIERQIEKIADKNEQHQQQHIRLLTDILNRK